MKADRICKTEILGDLTDPPFYLPVFEDAYRFIIDDYSIPDKNIVIFIPCAIRKPYSSSPSHRLFRRVIDSILAPGEYQIIIFGTCGTVPAELELMYPFAHYHFMLGKCTDERIRRDFHIIETYRIAGFLEKTRQTYKKRIAYCIGPFRDAMIHASQRTGIAMDMLLPSNPTIERQRDEDCPFPEGSLSMKEYVNEFRAGLQELKNTLKP
jgi:archaeosine synthase